VTTKSKERGTKTETMTVRYLQKTWPAAERRAMRGNADPGDVVNVPFTTIEVKGDRSNRLAKWQAETLKERDNNGDPLCLLVVRVAYRPVEAWDAWMPLRQLGFDMEGWLCVSLAVAVEILKYLLSGLSSPSSATTA
jgi:hypothetical protein